jgi:large subunit ribosomal protein L23
MNKEKLLTLIHSPYITEKATSIGSLNQVVFKVDLSASKSEIKKAVEDLFDVQVESVTTSTQKETDLEYIKDQITKKPLFH